MRKRWNGSFDEGVETIYQQWPSPRFSFLPSSAEYTLGVPWLSLARSCIYALSCADRVP